MAVPRTTTRLPGYVKRGKFFYLFLVQVLLLVLFPYLERSGFPMVIFRLLGALAFFAAVYAVSDNRAQWVTAFGLAIPAGVLNTIFVFRPDSQIAVPTAIFSILFLAYTLVLLLRAVVYARTIT